MTTSSEKIKALADKLELEAMNVKVRLEVAKDLEDLAITLRVSFHQFHVDALAAIKRTSTK